MNHQDHRITFQVTAGVGWSALQEQLDAAHEEIRSKATSGGRNGVLITRHSHDSFTVEVSPKVPYGMTYEREKPMGCCAPSGASLLPEVANTGTARQWGGTQPQHRNPRGDLQHE
jgi:hypothetical protein